MGQQDGKSLNKIDLIIEQLKGKNCVFTPPQHSQSLTEKAVRRIYKDFAELMTTCHRLFVPVVQIFISAELLKSSLFNINAFHAIAMVFNYGYSHADFLNISAHPTADSTTTVLSVCYRNEDYDDERSLSMMRKVTSALNGEGDDGYRGVGESF